MHASSLLEPEELSKLRRWRDNGAPNEPKPPGKVIVALLDAHDAHRQALVNLLATIHGDGGHRIHAVGLVQATSEAHVLVAEWAAVHGAGEDRRLAGRVEQLERDVADTLVKAANVAQCRALRTELARARARLRLETEDVERRQVRAPSHATALHRRREHHARRVELRLRACIGDNMPKNIEKIIAKVLAHAQQLRQYAAYSGEHHDGGASRLEAEVRVYKHGLAGTIPPEWQRFANDVEREADPEWSEYRRLARKFEGDHG